MDAKVLTYTGSQPNNREAYRIFLAFKTAQPGGDFIDYGLSITQQLELQGFGLVKLAERVEVGRDK
ncbi:MAG: hypothetical protein ACK5PF_08840 [bacterium]|jgi:hypothetical protein